MEHTIIVAPAYKERNIGKFLIELHSNFPNFQVICPCDDKETAEEALKFGAIVPHHVKRLGYGKSMIEGLTLAYNEFNCDAVIQIDVDHPVSEINKMLETVKKFNLDMCIGKEMGEWNKSRRLACSLVNNLVVNVVDHPTCGFTYINRSILSKIPFDKIKSDSDFIHIELLQWASKCHSFCPKIGQFEFSEHRSGGYGLNRMVKWLKEFVWFRIFH